MVKSAVSLMVVAALLVGWGCKSSVARKKTETAVNAAEKAEMKTQSSQPAQTARIDDSNAPAMVFESTTHDFGNIDSDSRNATQFKFTNTGKGTLNIGQVQSTCGCTVPALDKNTYAPGESGVLKVEYHATKHPGPVSKQLFVPSNDPVNPRIELVLKANIVLKVEYTPENLRLSLDKPNGDAQPITIKSTDGKPFAVTSIESPNNAITANIDPNATASSFTIPLTVDTAKLRNNLMGAVQLRITHPSIDIISIPYSAPAEYETQPGSIIVRDAVKGQVSEREIWVKSNYDKPFEIESITSKNANIKLLKQEKLDNIYKLTVNVIAPADSKMMFFSDALMIKIKNGPELTVNCRGFYSRQQSR